jgi:hypothetical protein
MAHTTQQATTSNTNSTSTTNTRNIIPLHRRQNPPPATYYSLSLHNLCIFKRTRAVRIASYNEINPKDVVNSIHMEWYIIPGEFGRYFGYTTPFDKFMTILHL